MLVHGTTDHRDKRRNDDQSSEYCIDLSIELCQIHNLSEIKNENERALATNATTGIASEENREHLEIFIYATMLVGQ